VRGFADWAPNPASLELINQVNGILREYQAQLPLTARQVFYRLVGKHGYSKTEQAYASLCEKLNRARRAGLINFSSIRDDGTASQSPGGMRDEASFYRSVRYWAEQFDLDVSIGQPRHVELWVEAGGMLPQAAAVANPLGVAAYSAGGFNSLTDKHATAQRVASARKPVTILHVGDYDPSGLAIIDSLASDINAFYANLSYDQDEIEWRRIAVTAEQIEEFSLPTAPQKHTDVRGEHMDETVQAEALDPQTLADIIREAVEGELDLDLIEARHEEELGIRERLVAWVDRADADGAEDE
jgi:hypothetical protein